MLTTSSATMSSSPATPLDYFSNHRDPLHSYGGYAPNFPPIQTSLNKLPPIPLSTTRHDYLAPVLLPPAETTSCGQVFLGRSGFSVNKALHNPSNLDVMRARRAQAAEFYSLRSKLAGDCTIPDKLQTEYYERFNENSLSHDPCGLPRQNFMHTPGSRESGFTNCYSSINPVYWRQHDSLMDQLNKNPPELRMNAASVSQTDYQPYDLINYETSPITGTIKVRGQGTGYITGNRELSPCFLPQPCVYSHHTPSYVDEGRFESMYNRDYKHRRITCGKTTGLEMLSSGEYKPKALSNESSPEFSLGCGPPISYLSETRDSFYNHWPLEGQRTLGLANPISTVSPSGFVHSIKKHTKWVNPCDATSVDLLDTTPQRYNPWPRFNLGHQILVDKNYRPNPLRSGIDYTITTSLPTTSGNATQFLY